MACMPHAPRLLLAALAVCAAAPSAAAAADATYHVKIAASGVWEEHERHDHGSGDVLTEDYRLGWAYVTEYDDVVFRDGRLASVGDVAIQKGSVAVETATQTDTGGGSGTRTTTCVADDEGHPTFWGAPRLEQDPLAGLSTETLVFRPAEHLLLQLACDDDTHVGIDLTRPPLLGNEPEMGTGPVDVNLAIPREAIGRAHYEELVTPADAQVTPERCPGNDGLGVLSCKLTWDAHVTMDRTDGGGHGTTTTGGGPVDVPVPPAPAPATTTRTPTTPTTPSTPPKASAPKVTGGRLAADRRHVKLTVACPAGAPCTGTAKVKGMDKPLAFSVAAGRRKTVTLKLRKAARRGTKVAVSVAVTPKGGVTARRTLTVAA
jgi:hypothetical protein